MSAAKREQIFRKVGPKTLEVWCNTKLEDFKESDLVDAFKTYITQEQEDKNSQTAEVWDLLRKGADREKAGSRQDEMRSKILDILSDGIARVPNSVKQDLEDDIAMERVFKGLNEEFVGIYLDGFRAEINDYRLSNNTSNPSLSESSKRTCTFM